ncbi:MAG TPA: SDR family oxidoreductase [Bacillota bacterium]|jgi:short-subunit dehydrogenase|nr:SDR family oxidoreductase [Bacillota bacterium]HOL09516.1 SDR family oxidoreductase [Bacillota bacterium]HPO98699.1 SDR family oxidoreductase [Bacillota bacterium]
MNQTVLITGASSGIGFELAKLFASNQYNLVLIARRQDRLLEFAAEYSAKYPIKITVISKDLALPTAPDEIYQELKQKAITIDILVNNAGTQIYGEFQNIDLQAALSLLQVNIIAVTHLTRLLINDMITRGTGKIVNLGSTGSFAPGPLNAIYCASKAYVLSFSESLSKDLEGTGVTVTAICPGATATEFAAKAEILNTRIFATMVMKPDKVARIGYRALQSGRRIVVTGLYNKLLVFSIRFTPRWLILSISKFLMRKKA